MNDVATIIQDVEKIKIEEAIKQGNSVEFNSGKHQSVVRTSIPNYQITIDYQNIDQTRFIELRDIYENNHANTVTLDVDSVVDDIRKTNAKTWMFSEFKFKLDGSHRFSGRVSLISSVLFNYPEYTSGITNASSYDQTANESLDNSFMDLLQVCTPYEIEYEYLNNSLASQIGSSIHHAKDKGGLRRRFKYSWYLKELDFVELQRYFRKKSILGAFGITELGTFGVGNTLKKTFKIMNDSVQFERNKQNMFSIKAEVVEVIV